MRSLGDTAQRWHETLKHSSSLRDLQAAVGSNTDASPAVSGCRSVCWKAFLFGQVPDTSAWSQALIEARSSYASVRDHYLKYIKHPEHLAAGAADPLTDDADSPWNTLRHDETLRAEILQDVQRLPDEPFYHQDHIQTMILDLLFIYCKLNPDVGGYRQGMHELLAPIVYVVSQDAIHPADVASDASADLKMFEALDSSFMEHDSFALFSNIMKYAKAFYEVEETLAASSFTPTRAPRPSSIVTKSQYIHEVCLYKADPELSDHLTAIEILPQIFLIRWVRLLFSREFPFEQMLGLWDALFAVDPALKLIDYVCTAMLLRIRWQLLEQDYSGALRLLLKYPPPEAPHGPHTFVGDAVYLKDHCDVVGGSKLILKYTGKPPSSEFAGARPSTPLSPKAQARMRTTGTRSPLSPPRFLSQQGGVEALFQGAAKGVLERSEKLGINRAVRDAMLEFRRNVSEAKSSMKTSRDILNESETDTTMQAIAVMDRRNRRLAETLDETILTLRTLASSGLEEKEKTRESLEVTAAKIQFVKLHMEDSTLALSEDEELIQEPKSHLKEVMPPPELAPVEAVPNAATYEPHTLAKMDQVNLSGTEVSGSGTPLPVKAELAESVSTGIDPLGSGTATPTKPSQRPQAPIPTRSTLAQSSFAWMLEPDQSGSAQSSPTFPSKPSNPHKKRPSANVNRERTAFLFGDGPSDSSSLTPQGIFGMEPIEKPKD